MSINNNIVKAEAKSRLPQTLDGKCWRATFDQNQRRRLTQDIGSLCLTEDNGYIKKCLLSWMSGLKNRYSDRGRSSLLRT
jgi:hypothetical protein